MTTFLWCLSTWLIGIYYYRTNHLALSPCGVLCRLWLSFRRYKKGNRKLRDYRRLLRCNTLDPFSCSWGVVLPFASRCNITLLSCLLVSGIVALQTFWYPPLRLSQRCESYQLHDIIGGLGLVWVWFQQISDSGCLGEKRLMARAAKLRVDIENNT